MSMENHEFDWRSDSWTLNREITIDVDEVLWLLAPGLHEPYRRVFRYFAENRSAAYCGNIHFFVRKFLETMGTQEFEATALKNYRASLERNKETYLGKIRAFLLRWHEQGYPGVTDEAAEWLDKVKLKKNPTGQSVLSMDPNDGPFHDQELTDILQTSAQQYELEEIDLATLTFTMLLSLTGRRAGQLALLRLGDVMQSMTTDGQRIDIVRIPRAKQRGQAPRSQFKNFWVTPDVWMVVTAQREAVIEKVQSRFGPLPGNMTAELPLFPNWHAVNRMKSIKELGKSLSNDALHARMHKLREGVDKIRVVSAHTGRRLHITPRRFRYTLGTRAAREGYGAMVIAEHLDHSDVQNVWVYTRDHPNFRRTVDKAVGKQLAPVAARFAGKVVDSESEARYGNDPAMRVGTRTVKVGTCGSAGDCRAGIVACYTCIHFQAWVHAPHEERLNAMLEDQRRWLEAGASERVVEATEASIQGARAVIAACKARKAKMHRAVHGQG